MVKFPETIIRYPEFLLLVFSTLSNLENRYWVCNALIDPLKPVKLYKEDDEDVVIEEKLPKKETEK